MKAKLKFDYTDKDGCLYHKDSVLDHFGGRFKNNNGELPGLFVKNNPAIFELIPDEPEYLRVVKCSSPDFWYKYDVGKIYKITGSDKLGYFTAPYNSFHIDKYDCEVISKEEYANCLANDKINITPIPDIDIPIFLEENERYIYLSYFAKNKEKANKSMESNAATNFAKSLNELKENIIIEAEKDLKECKKLLRKIYKLLKSK